MNTAYEKYFKLILKILVAASLLILFYAAIKFLLPFLAPFVIAVIIALINEPLVEILEKRVKISRKIAALISLVVTISILGVLLVFGAIKVYNELVYLQSNISSYMNDISTYMTDYFNKLNTYYKNLPVSVSSAIDQNLKEFTPKLKSIIESVAAYMLNTVSSIPKLALYTITSLLSAYFISSDRREIREFIYRQLPESWSKNFSGIKKNAFAAIFGYFKAILLLMFFTFAEASIGLFIIKADYALLMGIIIGISDAVPIFGTGIIFIPWIVWNLITGNMNMVFGLAIIYVVGVIVRQILEPKIVGSQIGLHPLATLLAIYIGLAVFGVWGMFIGPITLIILKNIQETGIIKFWNE